MGREGGLGSKIAPISPVSDSFAPIKDPPVAIWTARNGLSASMPIGLLTEMVKLTMNAPVTTDIEVESDIVIYILAEYQSTK